MDVDLAKYLAKELSLGTPEFVEAVSAQRETLIQTDQVKFIVGTYSITDARKEKVSFAGPYFIAGQDLLVRADDNSITGVESLNGKKLCSVKGSTSAANVQKAVPGVNLQEYGTYTLCVDALKAKNVDALTTDDTILAGYAAQEANKGLMKVVGKTFSKESYGVASRRATPPSARRSPTPSPSTSPVASGRRRSTRTSARPATSPAPATRPPRRPAPDPAPPARYAVRPPGRTAYLP